MRRLGLKVEVLIAVRNLLGQELSEITPMQCWKWASSLRENEAEAVRKYRKMSGGSV